MEEIEEMVDVSGTTKNGARTKENELVEQVGNRLKPSIIYYIATRYMFSILFFSASTPQKGILQKQRLKAFDNYLYVFGSVLLYGPNI